MILWRKGNMNSRRILPLCVLLLSSVLANAADGNRDLRVCADPDNLPFSNERLVGFENKIAQLIAADLRAGVQFTWVAQSKGSISQALSAGKCNLVMGAPAGWGPVLTTNPYYSSAYVFVYLASKPFRLSSFDDAALSKLRIGLPLISGGGANPPPAYALARRGLDSNVIGFSALAPGNIIDAVVTGEIDVAVVWGPLGGYFAKREPTQLTVTPIINDVKSPSLRFTYDISMGVKQGDTELKDQLEHVLQRRQGEIRKVLEEYGIPLISSTGSEPTPAKATQ